MNWMYQPVTAAQIGIMFEFPPGKTRIHSIDLTALIRKCWFDCQVVARTMIYRFWLAVFVDALRSFGCREEAVAAVLSVLTGCLAVGHSSEEHQQPATGGQLVSETVARTWPLAATASQRLRVDRLRRHLHWRPIPRLFDRFRRPPLWNYPGNQSL